MFGTAEATREAIAAICGRFDAPHVLDIGCGEGHLLCSLAPCIARGVGIDIAESAISTARQRAAGLDHLRFRVACAEQVSEADFGVFDIALFGASLEHMADPRVALQTIRACVREGGLVVVVVIAPQAPHAILSRWWLKHSQTPVILHSGVSGLQAIAASVGFQVHQVTALYRGSRQGRAARMLGPLLQAYDRLGGPTQVVALEDAAAVRSEPGTAAT